MEGKIRKFALSGGEGCGKSDLGKMLARLGYDFVSEIPEQIIMSEKAKALLCRNYKPVLPNTDIVAFEDSVVKNQIRAERRAVEQTESGLIFLDRTLVDPFGYARKFGITLPEGLDEKVREAGYQRMVFFPESHSCYENTLYRPQSKDEAMQMGKILMDVYREMGFEPVIVPDFARISKDATMEEKKEAIFSGVVERARYVLEKIGSRSEIEKKFLIREGDDDYSTDALRASVGDISDIYIKSTAEGTRIVQGYLPLKMKEEVAGYAGISPSFDPEEIRIRKAGSQFYVTFKAGNGAVRNELEVLIDEARFDHLLPSCTSKIEKTRYRVPYNGMEMEIDVYAGMPLVIAEIEGPSLQQIESLPHPGLDVTAREEYKNRNLAR